MGMEWQFTLISIVSGTLLPSTLLWVIGRKALIDVKFWELLLINACTASMWQIPVAGVWVCLPVCFGFFCLLSDISRIQSLWMALLSYTVCAVVGFAVLHYSKDAPDARIATAEAVSPVTVEETLPVVNELAISPQPAQPVDEPLVAPPSIGSAPDWLSRKYTVQGIAKSGSKYRAVVNGAIVEKGDELESGAMVVGLEADRLIVRHKGGLVALHLATVL